MPPSSLYSSAGSEAGAALAEAAQPISAAGRAGLTFQPLAIAVVVAVPEIELGPTPIEPSPCPPWPVTAAADHYTDIWPGAAIAADDTITPATTAGTGAVAGTITTALAHGWPARTTHGSTAITTTAWSANTALASATTAWSAHTALTSATTAGSYTACTATRSARTCSTRRGAATTLFTGLGHDD